MMPWTTPANREEEERKLLAQLGFGAGGVSSLSTTTATPSRFDTFAASIDSRARAQPEERDRTFFDRLFAPLEAPQQTLFALTTGRGLWDSLSHGARYFNPFSNEERIDPEEVRQTLFGDMADGWVKTTANLAIGLLFDPLLIAPVSKVAGVSERAAKFIDKAVNPAALLVDAAGLAAKEVVGPLARTAYGRVFGAESLTKLDNLTTNVMQAVVNRFHGVDEGLADLVRSNQDFMANLRGEGVRAVKAINNLGEDARPLLSEALESVDVWSHKGRIGPVSASEAKGFATFEQRLLNTGTDPDLFWEAYSRVRNLDDEIGRYLLDLGAISTEKFAEMQGTHLRRIFQVHENPQLLAERIDYIAGLQIPDRVSASYTELRQAMTSFSDELFKTTGPLGVQADLFGQTAAQFRYFDQTGKFHAKNFTDDLIHELSRDSTRSLDELFTFIKNDMLDGIDLPGSFYADLGNWLSHGSVKVVEGSAARAEALRKGLNNTPTFTFRAFSEDLRKVQDRKDFPDWYAEALMEIVDPAPRIASEVKEAGGVVAARKLFDDISGTRRLSADDMSKLDNARALGLTTPEARAAFDEVAAKFNMTGDQLAQEISKLQSAGESVGAGTRIGPKGSTWASEAVNDALGHRYQIPNDPSYGEMAGMFVDAPTASLLRTVDARDTIRSAQGKAISKLGDLYRDGVGFFKFMKTVADPTSHARNFIGGAILADMQGTGWNTIKNIPKVRQELINWVQNGDLGHYMRIADEAGVNIWKQDFANVELQQLARAYLDEALQLGGREKHLAPFSAILRAVNDLSKRIPVVSWLAGSRGEVGGGIVDFAGAAFSQGDQFWKLGVFIDKYDKLAGAAARAGKEVTQAMSHDFARQAASLAQQALFNYSDVPWAIDMVRKWGVIPFATFPYKAAPFVAKTLYENPWRVLKYDRIADGLNSFWAGSPEDAANEIDGLPKHMRDSMVLRLPWSDDKGRPQYIDLSYFLPWQVVKDIAKTAEWDGGFRSGMAVPPAVGFLNAIMRNEDSLGRPIIETGTGRSNLQNFEALANYITSFALPSWVPGGSRAASMGRTMMALASTSPEPMVWNDVLGLVARSPVGAVSEALGLGDSVVRETTLGAGGTMPQAHSAFATSNPWEQLFGGVLTGFGAQPTASDPWAAMQQGVATQKRDRSSILREIAAVRSSSTLSMQEKTNRVNRLMQQLR